MEKIRRCPDKKLIVDDNNKWLKVIYKQVKVNHRVEEKTKVELEII